MVHLSHNVRIIRLITKKTQAEMALLFSVSVPMIKSYESGKANPDELFISRLAKYASVSETQLQNKRLSESDIKIKVEKVEDPKPTYLQTRRDLKTTGRPTGIPIYEAAPATLTNTPSVRDEGVDKDLPDFWVTIPQLRDCNYGTRAKGDSMYPLIRTNALVIGREIVDFKVIVFGEIYIVHTKNGIETVKYIHQSDQNPDIILLVPYNGKAKTTPIHKKDILRLYEAKAVFNTI